MLVVPLEDAVELPDTQDEPFVVLAAQVQLTDANCACVRVSTTLAPMTFVKSLLITRIV